MMEVAEFEQATEIYPLLLILHDNWRVYRKFRNPGKPYLLTANA